jgi:AraC family transcriptional regulator
VSETHYPANAVLGFHDHPSAFACFVLSGGFEERSRDGTRDIVSLSSLMRTAGERHANRFGARPSRCLNLAVDEEWLDEIGERPRSSSEGIVKRADTPIAALRLWVALEKEASEEVVEEAAITWMMTLVGGRGETHPPSRQLRVAREAVEAADRPLSIRVLAELADCHPVTLARWFRHCWGVGPAEYARRLRLQRACQAATRSDEPLSSIAARLGFSDQAHLTRALTAAVGLSPGALRRRLRD